MTPEETIDTAYIDVAISCPVAPEWNGVTLKVRREDLQESPDSVINAFFDTSMALLLPPGCPAHYRTSATFGYGRYNLTRWRVAHLVEIDSPVSRQLFLGMRAILLGRK